MSTLTRFAAVGAAITLAAMAAGPALAAPPPVSQASAQALNVRIAGDPAGNGLQTAPVAATHDGTEESTEGVTNPTVGVLGNQQLANLGVLAQDVSAQVDGGRGVSAACAGVAGEGGSVVRIGDSRCITPGRPIGLTLAHLDLSDSVLVDPESALAPLAPLNDVMGQLVGPITAALTEALAPLGEVGLVGNLGAVEARCEASPDGASGTANIADARLTLLLAGEEVDLVELPVNPAPNTKVVTDLDAVVTAVLDAVETNLEATFDGALADLTTLTEALQTQVVDTLLAELAPQLAPLEDNLLEITLNQQSAPADNAIEVTALDLQVLPAAQQLGADSLVNAQIGNVSCGPNAVVAQEAPAAPAAPEALPEVPTAVDAGLAEAPSPRSDGTVPAALVLMGVAGLVGYRFLATR